MTPPGTPGTRLAIRLAGPADGDAIASVYRPYVEGSVISFEATAPDAAEMARRVNSTLPTHPWIVGTIGGRVVGYAYAGTHSERAAYRWSTNVSVYVGEGLHRRGLGRRLYVSLFAILRAQGFVTAFAGVTLPNPASVGLHESFGFEPVGVYREVGYKFERWHDVGWWRLPLAERRVDPPAPRTMAEMLVAPEWPALLAAGEGGTA